MKNQFEFWVISVGYKKFIVTPSEKYKARRDMERHKEMDIMLVNMYVQALKMLADEGNQSAKVVLNAFDTHQERGLVDIGMRARDWAYNIHHNTWGTNSIAGILKARVVAMRIKENDGTKD